MKTVGGGGGHIPNQYTELQSHLKSVYIFSLKKSFSFYLSVTEICHCPQLQQKLSFLLYFCSMCENISFLSVYLWNSVYKQFYFYVI